MPRALLLTAISIIITTLIIRLMPPATITKVVCVFVVVLALSAAAASYLTMTQEPRKETPEERNKRKRKIQKELKMMFWPKKVELLGRRRVAKVEVVECGIGSYPVREEEQGPIQRQLGW